MFKSLETRKTITIWFAFAFTIFTALEMIFGKPVPVAFVSAVMLALGFYFGKATAQDKLPKKDL